MIFTDDPTTVWIGWKRRDGNGIVIDYTVHSGRRCDKFVLMIRQLSFRPVFLHTHPICHVTVGSGSERVSFIVDFESRDHMSKGGMRGGSVERLSRFASLTSKGGIFPRFDSV